MSRKDFDANKYLELAKSLKLDSMDDINDLFKNLSKTIIENSLNAEMDEHLGYDKWDQSSRNKSNNYRKGYSNKKVKSSFGEFDIKIPRDKDAVFKPTLVKKISDWYISFWWKSYCTLFKRFKYKRNSKLY